MVAKASGYIFAVFLCTSSVLLYLDFYVSDPVFKSTLALPHSRATYLYYKSNQLREYQLTSVPRSVHKSLSSPKKNVKLHSTQTTLAAEIQQQNTSSFYPIDDITNEFNFMSSDEERTYMSMIDNSLIENLEETHERGRPRLGQSLSRPEHSFMENLEQMEEPIRLKDYESDQKVSDLNYSFMQDLGEMEEHGQIMQGNTNQLQVSKGNTDDIDQLISFFLHYKESDKEDTDSKSTQPALKSTRDNNKKRKSKPTEQNKKNKNEVEFQLPESLEEIKRRYNLTIRTDVPEELYRLAPDVFDEIPSPDEFLKELTSPCWQRQSDNRLQCLPYFYLAGMPKCGTSDIWAKMNSHNGVFATRKEPHWWTRKRIGKLGARAMMKHQSNDTIKRQPLDEYLSRYYAMSDIIEYSFSAAYMVAGDGSASTFWDNSEWELYYPEYYKEGPPYIIGDVIHAVTPRSKIILMLRNPIDRLYSSYRYFWREKQPSNKKFHQLVVTAVANLYLCLQSRSLKACTYSISKSIENDKLGITIGFYDVFIKDWLKSFPREQLMVIRLEDWSKKCSSIMSHVFKLLRLAPLSPNATASLCTMKKARNKGPHIGGRILPETRQLLEYVYRPRLKNLADILEDDRWLWPETMTRATDR